MAELSTGVIALALLVGLGAAICFLWAQARLRHPVAMGRAVTASPPNAVPCVFVLEATEIVDMSPPAEQLLGNGEGGHSGDWTRLLDLLELRFPDLPADPADLPEGQRVFSPDCPNDPGTLLFLRHGDSTRIELTGDGATGMDGATLHRYRNARLDSLGVRQALDRTPNPIWFENRDGRIDWTNVGYQRLAQSLGYMREGSEMLPNMRIFDVLDPGENEFVQRRDRISGPGGDRAYWFDLCAVTAGRRKVVFAMNVDSVVNAEIAQRTFVQTLTKTFAQLSIGLAIFNRDRQLALFNPALLDLTSLPADFLSSRPTIMGFFDRLRDNQMMPEPKNYGTWRERVGTLVAAASDGRFHEVWTLASGQTYRVTGRPHPDGAVAFLFEDITVEVSQTRNYRTELALGYAVLNEIEDAVAVFTRDGVLVFSNTGFKELWGVDPDSAFADTRIADAVAIWRGACASDSMLDLIEAHLTSGDMIDGATLSMRNGRHLRCRVRLLSGGARMISFAAIPASAPMQAQPA